MKQEETHSGTHQDEAKKVSDVTYEEMYGKAPYFGQNDVMQLGLAHVLTRVPESVREFVLEKCVITSSAEPRLAGFVSKAQVPKRALDSPHEFWLIVLSDLMWRAGPDMLRLSRLRLKGNNLKDATKGQKGQWKEVAKRQNERWHHIIAHEIAHAYSGHEPMNPDLPEDTEAEAERLAAQWGFANPEPTK